MSKVHGDERERDLSAAQVQSREDELKAGLDQLSRIVLVAQSPQELLEYVSATAVHSIPRVDGVGITLLRQDIADHRLQTLAASDAVMAELETVQHEQLNEGPCIDAARDRVAVISGDLAADSRWPRFGERAAAAGLTSVLSLPMMVPGDVVVGALNCYSRASLAFDEHAARLGGVFAAAAAIAVRNSHVLERAQTKAAQLQTALVNRATIDQAIGILRSRSGASADEAFATLREISQHENVKLSIVAERVVAEAVRRARARHVQG